MSTNLDELVREIRAKRSEKFPQAKTRLEKINATKQAVHNTWTKAANVAANNPELQAKLSGIGYSNAIQLLDEAILSSENAVNRLQRTSINIGVAGKSGQGKSQILQMLTGLTDEQIPTGGGTACTAARSIVHNGHAISAKVHYLTTDALLEKKVYPSYAAKGTSSFALGLTSRRPASLDEFINMELPTVQTSDGTPTEAEDNWQKVIDLQKVLKKHRELVAKLGMGAETIDIANVRNYIVKDNGETLHNVVDYVEITTPFEIGLPEGLTVYDLPGLADPTPGIREDMFASLKNDADIVLFLRKAATDGDRELWKPEDNDAIDLLKSIYPVDDVKPVEWIQLILNLDSRNGHVNVNNTETLRKTVTKGFVPVICDCGKSDAVRSMINDNIDRLVENVARIDNLRINQAEMDYSAAMDEVRTLYLKLREASSDIVAKESGFNFKRHFLHFMSELRDPLSNRKKMDELWNHISESVETVLAKHFNDARIRFTKLCKEAQGKTDFPPEFPAFTRDRLIDEFGSANGPEDPVNKSIRTQREALMKLLREHLSCCCTDLKTIYWDSVVREGLGSSPSVQAVFSDSPHESSSNEKLRNLLSVLEKDSNTPTLESAVQGVLAFDLTFDGSILPALYEIRELDDFDPLCNTDERQELFRCITNQCQTKELKAAALSNWMEQKSDEILSSMASGSDRSPIVSISKYVIHAMKANYDFFVFHFIWGETCENEWESLVDSKKKTFWKAEFEQAEASSSIAKEWNAALQALQNALN